MTLRALERFIQSKEEEESIINTEISPAVDALRTRLIHPTSGKPRSFYKGWGKPVKAQLEHNKGPYSPDCCYVDIVGRPQKDNHDMPLLPYQKLLYQILHEQKCILIKKSRGIGVTTFFLYWLSYCCITRYQPGDRILIVVGPRIDAAQDLIARFKGLFKRNFPAVYSELTKQGSTYAILNGVKVECYPSHHVDSMRGYDRVKFILVDEADYFPPFQQKEVRSVVEGYLGKPNSEDLRIVMVSTPNAPGGMFQQIEQEPIDKTLYYKMILTYEYGLDVEYPIYSREQIELARKSPDFPREFEGKYLGQIGNVISPAAISRCLSLGEEMAKTTPIDNWDIAAKYVMGVDAAWGGDSKLAIVVARYVNGKVQIIHSSEMERPIFQAAINEIKRLVNKCYYGEGIQNILIDASNVEVYTTLCQIYGQNSSLKYLQEKQLYYKKINRPLEESLFVCPVPFSTQHKNMLAHLKRIIEDTDTNGTAIVAIDPRFEELTTALRTATSTELDLDKSATVHDDTLDAARLALSYFRFKR
jgi:hypothetical protein